MYSRQRPRPFLLFAILFCATNAIDWNSDIVPTDQELETAKKDALSVYFGSQVESGSLFRSYEDMLKLVGDHVDVPLKE
jgi:hypothetical protein